MAEYIVDYVIQPRGGMAAFDVRGELVRCGECANLSIDQFGGGWCNENCREVESWGYCAWAKRKESGDD